MATPASTTSQVSADTDAAALSARAQGAQALDAAQWRGAGLVRPECVLATARGDVFTADWRGGVAHLLPDGSQRLYLGQPLDGEPLKPNGIALCRDGSFLLTHLGAEQGGVFRL